MRYICGSEKAVMRADLESVILVIFTHFLFSFNSSFASNMRLLFSHLHDKALFMGAPRLCRQLILQAAALLIQLHHRVLAIFGQNRTLTTLSITKG